MAAETVHALLPAGARATDAILTHRMPLMDPTLTDTALQRKLAGLEGLLNRVPCGALALLSLDLRCLWASSALAAVVRRPAAELVGRPLGDFWPELADIVQSSLEAMRPDQTLAARFVVRPPCPDLFGAPRRYQGQFDLLRSFSGDEPLIALTVDPPRDAWSAVGREQLDRPEPGAIGEVRLLARIAHELKNAQTPLLSAAQMLQRHGTSKPEVLHWALATIERQVRRTSNMVNDLLDLARVERGELEVVPACIDLRPLLVRAMESLRMVADEKDILLNSELPDPPVLVSGDAGQFERVLRELLGNAVKFTPSGGRIGLSAVIEQGEVVITVKDTGIGLHTELQQRIFEPFFKAHGPGPAESRGMGVGLTLARSLIALQGGTLHAHSGGPGRGTEFSIRIRALGVPDPAE